MENIFFNCRGEKNFSNMTDKYSVTIAKKILKPKIN